MTYLRATNAPDPSSVAQVQIVDGDEASHPVRDGHRFRLDDLLDLDAFWRFPNLTDDNYVNGYHSYTVQNELVLYGVIVATDALTVTESTSVHIGTIADYTVAGFTTIEDRDSRVAMYRDEDGITVLAWVPKPGSGPTGFRIVMRGLRGPLA